MSALALLIAMDSASSSAMFFVDRSAPRLSNRHTCLIGQQKKERKKSKKIKNRVSWWQRQITLYWQYE